MKNRLTAAFLSLLVFAFSGTAKDWRGIVPLHSTRADVERVLNMKPLRCGGNACIYKLEDTTVFALYAAEPTCRRDDATTSWKVPRDTVIEISVWFKTPKLLSDLQIDLRKYERVPDQELRGLVYFRNYVEGVEIESSGDSARRITYYHAETDNHLRCPAKPEVR